MSNDGLDARLEGVRTRSNEGRGARPGGMVELWGGAFEGVRVLGIIDDGIDTTGGFSRRATDAALERPVTGIDGPG